MRPREILINCAWQNSSIPFHGKEAPQKPALNENSQEGAQALGLSGGLRQTCRSNFVVVGPPVPVNHNKMLSVFALAPSYVPTGPMRAAVATRRAPNAAAIAVTRETADISTNAGTCVQVRHRRRPGRCPLISCTFTTTPRHRHDHLLATNAHLVLLPRRSGRRASLRTSPRSRAGSTRRRRRRRRRTSGSACTRTRASTTRTTTRCRTRRTRGDDPGSRGWVSSTRGRVSSTVCVPDVCRLLFLGNFPYGELSNAHPRALGRDAPRAILARAAAVDRRAQRLVHRERRAGAAS